MMDHDFAVKNKMIERYLLDELTENDRDAFEEHYFECPECAEELRYGSEFIAYGQRALREGTISPPLPAPPGFFRKMAWPAGAVVTLALAFGAYHQIASHSPLSPEAAQSVQPSDPATPAPNKPDPVPGDQSTVVLALKDARGPGEGRLAVILSPGQQLRLRFRVRQDVIAQGFASYEAVIRTNSGNELVRHISRDEADDVVEWLLPAGSLDAGNYFVKIRAFTNNGVLGQIKGKDPSFPFTLQDH